MPVPESATVFLAGLIERARRSKKRIVFPEGSDPRVLNAAARLAQQGIVQPILIATRPESAPEGVTFIDPGASPATSKYAALYYERRRAKGITQVEAAAIARRPLDFAALMVAAGDADGSVGGGGNTTAGTGLAPLDALGAEPGVRLLSSVFIIAVHDRDFGDKGLLAFA